MITKKAVFFSLLREPLCCNKGFAKIFEREKERKRAKEQKSKSARKQESKKARKQE
jgi:hypothetical protein